MEPHASDPFDLGFLRKERAALTRMADAMPVIVLVLDHTLALRFANRPWYDLVGGVAEAKDPGPAFRQLIHADDLATVEALFEASSSPETRVACEARLEQLDGSFHWYLVEAQHTGTELGPSWEALVTCVDIEEQKQTNAALAEKTRALEAADRQKDHFLAVLGHEIRNPLAAIANAVTAIELGQDEAWALDVLQQQTTMLGLLVDDLLDDARMRQGRIRLRRTSFDLADVLRIAVDTSRKAAESGEVSLHLELPEEPIICFADRTRIQQVASNLLRNAVKFSAAGDAVHVRARRQGNRLTLTVRDEGEGIPEPMLERIFEPWVQLSDDASHPDQGLGVGLSLVRHLVTLHEGTIQAASDGPGGGSTFTVELPLKEEPAEQASEAGNRELPSKKRSRRAPIRRVLLVDDNDDGREGLARILTAHGLEVEEASRADEALASVRAAAPDVAILDIGLPDRSGYELAQEIRALLGTSGPRLLALSGYPPRQAETANPFDEHLLKPVDLARLLGLLGVAG